MGWTVSNPLLYLTQRLDDQVVDVDAWYFGTSTFHAKPFRLCIILAANSSIFNSHTPQLLPSRCSMASFSRTLWQAGRLFARPQSSVNAVQQSLGLRGSNQYVAAWRTYATFQRDKPHVNIGGICADFNITMC